MAQDSVVKDQLTDAMVEAGAALTEKLDDRGLRTTAAFWLFEPEIGEWRLVFASPELATKGRRELYAEVGQAIDQLGSSASAAPLSSIRLLEDDAELIQVLRRALQIGPTISRVRFSKNAINGHFVEDALIYRMM